MRKVITCLVLIALGVALSTAAYALTVNAKSVSSGTYEDGKFSPGDSGFEAEYRIDEAAGEVRLIKIISNDREGRIEEGASYEITNSVVSKGISALSVSRNKKGQNIVTAVREAGIDAFEVLVIGGDFYELSRAANGKFYLEYGDVTGPKR